MRRIHLVGLLILGLLLSVVHPAQAAGLDVQNVTAAYEFGAQVTFHAEFVSEQEIDSVYLFLQPEGEDTRLEQMPVAGGAADLQIDLKQSPLRPFARTYYWFRVTLADGTEVTTPSYWFDYIDNRFEWQTLENNLFQAYWHDDSLEFGQTILNISQEALDYARAILPVDPQFPVKIYVYSSTQELQSALELANASWVAGHASPDLGLILISAPSGPDQTLELERQIPHELIHLMQYQASASAYANLPVWLVEGMASAAELYPNPDYNRVLSRAVETDSLLPISSLCQNFPQEVSGAFLAYAESASFVGYLKDVLGTSSMVALFRQYQDGKSCEEGFVDATGLTISQMEQKWKETSLEINTQTIALKNLLPYGALLLLVVIPVVLTRFARERTPEASEKTG